MLGFVCVGFCSITAVTWLLNLAQLWSTHLTPIDKGVQVRPYVENFHLKNKCRQVVHVTFQGETMFQRFVNSFCAPPSFLWADQPKIGPSRPRVHCPHLLLSKQGPACSCL